MAAKAIRNNLHDSGLLLSDMKTRGEKQLKVELATKKRKNRTPEEKQLRQLQNAAKRLQKK